MKNDGFYEFHSNNKVFISKICFRRDNDSYIEGCLNSEKKNSVFSF